LAESSAAVFRCVGLLDHAPLVAVVLDERGWAAGEGAERHPRVVGDLRPLRRRRQVEHPRRRVASRSAVEATLFVKALSLPSLRVANPPWVSPSVEARVPARCPDALDQ
jgi:hypothetical protein